jgi:hypothetical protein
MPSTKRLTDRLERLAAARRADAIERYVWMFERFTDAELRALFRPKFEGRDPQTPEETVALEKYMNLSWEVADDVLAVSRTQAEIDRWNRNAADAITPRLQQRISRSKGQNNE